MSILIALISLTVGNVYAQDEGEEQSIMQNINDFYAYKQADQYEKAISQANKIVNYYWKAGEYELAIKYYKESIPLNEKLNNQENLKNIYSNLGLLYIDLQQQEKAIPYFKKSLRIKRRLNNQKGIVSGLYDLAYGYGLTGEYQRGTENLLEALKIARKENYSNLTLVIYNLLGRFYENMGDIASAEKYKEKYDEYNSYLKEQQYKSQVDELREQKAVEKRRRELENKERALEIKQEQLKRDSLNRIAEKRADSIRQQNRRQELLQEKYEVEQQALKNEKQARKAEEKARKRTVYALALLLVLSLVVAIAIFIALKVRQKAARELARKNKEISSKNEELSLAFNQIEEKNDKITQSINYAQHIQEAMIPEKNALQQYLPDSFILYKPLENVSGDFYWFNEVNMEKDKHEENKEFLRKMKSNGQDKKFLPIDNNKFVISSIDCTGHGVPGAFMSMIGNNLMYEAINNGITKPDLILNFLDNGVRQSLNQDVTQNKDGMDMSLCVINKYKRTVEFAGANNPLVYIQDGEAKTIKGDRKSIGGIEIDNNKGFSRHEIKIDRPTYFYIFSDGYIDQFGGPKGRKLLLKNFIKKLESIHQEPIEQQGKFLEQHFESWRGDTEKQIDDVLVIGFKLNVPDKQDVDNK